MDNLYTKLFTDLETLRSTRAELERVLNLGWFEMIEAVHEGRIYHIELDSRSYRHRETMKASIRFDSTTMQFLDAEGLIEQARPLTAPSSSTNSESKDDRVPSVAEITKEVQDLALSSSSLSLQSAVTNGSQPAQAQGEVESPKIKTSTKTDKATAGTESANSHASVSSSSLDTRLTADANTKSAKDKEFETLRDRLKWFIRFPNVPLVNTAYRFREALDVVARLCQLERGIKETLAELESALAAEPGSSTQAAGSNE